MTAPSSWQIEKAMSAALKFRDQLRADIGECDEDTLLCALDSETDVVDLLRLVLRSADESKHFAAAVAARIKSLQERKHRFEAREQSARGLAIEMIDALGLKDRKFIDPEVTAKCGTTKPKISVPDASAVPDALVEIKTVITRELLMDKITAFLETAQEPPNWASIVPGNPTITIRIK